MADDSQIPDYNLFTSFRYDPKLRSAPFNVEISGEGSPYLLFPYHVERLAKAAESFCWPKAVRTISAPDAALVLKQLCDQTVADCALPDKENGLGLRVLLTPGGELRVEIYPVQPLLRDPLQAAYFNPDTNTYVPQPIFDVYIDTRPTPSSLYTSYKTTVRAHYDSARARAGIKDRKVLKEVILYNEHGEVTEGSVRNVAFWRGGKWVAPTYASGGLPGTVQRYLMERGLVTKEVVYKDDLKMGEWVLMSNGFDVTVLGKIVERN